MTTTNAERCESAKEKKRAKGWTRLELWIPKRFKPRLKRIEAILQRRAKDEIKEL